MKSCIQITSSFSFIFTLLLLTPVSAEPAQKSNVLFIAIDDLKPILGCYGNRLIKTPNIDRLAKMGTVFKSNYCQQAICGPTRASLMTGKRPDATKVWDLKAKLRQVSPNIVSLPQYFAAQGYSTQGIGKVYDSRNVDADEDKLSWSVPYHKTKSKYYDAANGEPLFKRYQNKNTKLLADQFFAEAVKNGMNKKDATEFASTKIKPSVESEDLPDNAYNDGANALQAADILKELSKKNQPFFFAVGFAKPHLPFVAPKKYWDLYQRTEMPIASFQEQSTNSVAMAYHDAGELRAYTDIPPLLAFTDQKASGLTLPIEKQKELIHGYYAAISYTDAQVGILLDTLDVLRLTKNTIVILWGDHGWHLGDHNLWCKHSNFEEATRTPLIISAPGIAASSTEAMSEFVDIFPTLCDLSGLKIPGYLDGKSLIPIMKQTAASVKNYSISQYPRTGTKSETARQGYSSGKVMGYSLRNHRYRYTIWLANDFKSSQPFNAEWVVGTELYDYEKDPKETINVANEKDYKSITEDLNAQLIGFLKTQVNSALPSL